MVAPAPAPARPKHAIVDRVGYAPLVLAITSGELPVAWYIQSSMAYLERWYMEKETVRTRVMLRRGDHTPVGRVSQASNVCWVMHTAPEAMKTLGAIGMSDTVAK
jgi:hypothetical protein